MEEIFKQNLGVYYRKYYPVPTLYNYLTIHKPLDNREFSFTIGDLYIRYQSFKTAPEIRKRLLSLVPHKIDLGAIFSKNPTTYKQHPSLCALEKEYVIDIDITDYDNVRLCGCRDAGYCRKCWKLMNHSMTSLNYMFDNSFDISEVMWVYSGRRGIHAWVTDPRLFEMDTVGRSAISEYLHLYTGGKESIRSVSLGDPIHPLFRPGYPLYKSTEKCFLEVFGRDMKLFQDADHRQWLFHDVFEFDNENPRHVRLKKRMNDFMNQVEEEEEDSGDFFDDEEVDYRKMNDNDEMIPEKERLWSIEGVEKVWNRVKAILGKEEKPMKTRHIETIYSLVHPRLDINVSKHLNHLLKAPFCVHPKTGKVCVPVPSDEVATYYPDDDCPLLENLINENPKDIESMKKYVGVMKEHISDVKKVKEKQKEKNGEVEAKDLEF